MSTSAESLPFKGKKVLVTGAGRGIAKVLHSPHIWAIGCIGKAVVKDLYSKGAFIYALSRNADNLESLKEECPNIQTICVDLANWEETRGLLENNVDYVDALINNAGVCPRGGFQEIDPKEFDKLFSINVKGVINVSQVISKKMIARGKGGSIVNVSSICALKPSPMVVAYGCSKAALEMLTKCMAIELGPHKITVNSVCPGPVDTDMCRPQPQDMTPENKAALEEVQKMMESMTPTKTFFMPMRDVVNAITFFASGVTSQITGESIAIDGGFIKA